VDTVIDDRGQAAVLAVFLIAIAAVVIVGLRSAQDRVFVIERSRRAGEAAAEAATSAVADEYTAELRRAAPGHAPDPLGALQARSTREGALSAAREASAVNGGGEIADVTVRCGDGRVEVAVIMSGASYRAGFPASECSRH